MAPGKAAKGKQNAAHGKKKSGNPSVAKSKIANKKDEQQRQLLDRAQARRNKVKSEKAQHSHIVEHQPVKSDLNRVKAEIQEKKREKRRQRKESKRSEQFAAAQSVPSLPTSVPMKAVGGKSDEKAKKPRKSVSFAV